MATKENFLRATRCGAGLAVVLTLMLCGCSQTAPGLLREGEKLIKQDRFADAIRKLEVARDRLPQEARAWNLLGVAYHSQGRTREAMGAYRQALALDRNLAAARYNLGWLFFEQENYPAALAEFTTYAGIYPNSAEAWTRLGLAQAKARQPEAAEKSLAYALKLQSNNPEALNALGLIQVSRKRLRDGTGQFEEALAQNPRFAPALLNLAILRHQAGDRGAALEKYHAFLNSSPKPANWTEVDALARALEAELNPKPQPAKPATNSATAAPPAAPTIAPAPRPTYNTNVPPAPVVTITSRPAPAVLATPVASNATTRPARTLPPAPAAPPLPKVEIVQLTDDPLPKAATAVALTRPAKETPTARAPVATPPPPEPTPTTAKKTSTVTSERRPGGFWQKVNPATWFEGGDEKPRTTKPTPLPTSDSTATGNTSRTVSRSAPTPDPASVKPLPEMPRPTYAYLNPTAPRPGDRPGAEKFFNLGAQAHRDGKLTSAITEYLVAVKTDPAYFEAHYNLGLAAFEAGNLPRSLSAYEQALSIKPTDANTRYNFALALQQAGHVRDAANELEILLTASPRETRAHLTLAQLYAQSLNQKSRAREHYQRVIDLDPKHPQATPIRVWLGANP